MLTHFLIIDSKALNFSCWSITTNNWGITTNQPLGYNYHTGSYTQVVGSYTPARKIQSFIKKIVDTTIVARKSQCESWNTSKFYYTTLLGIIVIKTLPHLPTCNVM